jgi:hypothetical protein
VQLEDIHYRGATEDRFTYVVGIDSGPNSITVPLDGMGAPSGTRPLDLHNIAKIYFLTSDSTQTITIYIDNIRLR